MPGELNLCWDTTKGSISVSKKTTSFRQKNGPSKREVTGIPRTLNTVTNMAHVRKFDIIYS